VSGKSFCLSDAKPVHLLPRVCDLDGQAVAETLERFHLGTPPQLILHLLVDIGTERIEGLETCLDLLDELLMPGDARRLAVEVLGDRNERRRLLGPLLDDRELRGDGIHLGVEHRNLTTELVGALEKLLEGLLVGRQCRGALADGGVGLVEFLDFLPQPRHVLPALFHGLELIARPLGQFVHLPEPLPKRVEIALCLL